MKIMKFGGSVLKSREGFFNMIEILKKEPSRSLLIVVSAFSTATRFLSQAAEYAESGDEVKAYSILDSIISEHENYARELFSDKGHFDNLLKLYNESSNKIRDYLAGIAITGELTLRTLDIILSYGEHLALQTVHQFLLEQGYEHECVDSTSIIVTDSNYGKAEPVMNLTRKNVENILKPALENNRVVLTQGFVARSNSGEITTMGIESSNLTAALYSNILSPDELIFWTDVEGIRTADPKIIKNTKSLSVINFNDAISLSQNGLKLIYPTMLRYLEGEQIKISFKSAFNQDGESTIINHENNSGLSPVIILKQGLNIINFNLNYTGSEHEFDKLNKKNELALHNHYLFLKFADSAIISPIPSLKRYSLPKENHHKIYKNQTVITILNLDLIKKAILFDLLANTIKSLKPEKFDIQMNDSTVRVLIDDKFALNLAESIHKKLIENL